jgi:hypothetical protein
MLLTKIAFRVGFLERYVPENVSRDFYSIASEDTWSD